jgi:HlyD family secretion protein
MKLKKRFILIAAGALAALVVTAVIIISAAGAGAAPAANQFVTVSRGPIQTLVSSTGSINAQKSVDVGTQVSGLIAKLYVDFNDHVKKDQLLARLDTTLLDLAVQSATADQLKATAQYELALKDYNNNVKLHDQALISDYDYETSRVARSQAYAAKVGADVALNRAKINLSYAVIRAPISGVIVNRTVEEGQTVAASLSAPTLFTIAEDLANIQIKTYVAESDIGSIKAGQQVNFTVTTFPQDTFSGKVDVVHLQSETVQNVVNYVVMVSATNPGRKLMPGMTATVNFIVDERAAALLIPNAALQYRPADAVVAEYMQAHPELQGGRRNGPPSATAAPDATVSPVASPAATPSPAPSGSPDPAGNRRPRGNRAAADGTNAGNGDGANASTGRNARSANGSRFNRNNLKLLWTIDDQGRLLAVPVLTGITDGQNTEIISNRVTEGMKFLTNKGSANRNAANNNNQRGGGFGPFFH